MLSKNKIYFGDCFNLIKLIDDDSINCIITDPPYGINLTPQRNNSKFKNTKIINDDNLDWLPQYCKELYRVLKNNTCCYIFCNWQKYDIFKQQLEKYFEIKNCIVWDKDWLGMGNNWRPNHEFIILATKGKFKTKSNNKTNILKHRRLSSKKMLHSCEKPVSLIEELITESTNEKDLILDTFLGSGSTIEACIKQNRNYIGFELDENLYNIINNRINNIKEI